MWLRSGHQRPPLPAPRCDGAGRGATERTVGDLLRPTAEAGSGPNRHGCGPGGRQVPSPSPAAAGASRLRCGTFARGETTTWRAGPDPRPGRTSRDAPTSGSPLDRRRPEQGDRGVLGGVSGPRPAAGEAASGVRRGAADAASVAVRD